MTFTKPTAQRWGEAIRKARTDQELSIFDLATQTGMDPGHLSRVERGLAGIGDGYRVAIADALGLRADDLFTYEDPETPCPPADSAPDGATSPTPATEAATRSAAPSAAAQDASAREASPADEREAS
jgi:transcriptional regulator with XRE-family HTH domain